MKYLTIVLLAYLLFGCGSSDPDETDRRFQQCAEHGGSFKDDGYGEFECKMPDPQPTATVTVTEDY